MIRLLQVEFISTFTANTYHDCRKPVIPIKPDHKPVYDECLSHLRPRSDRISDFIAVLNTQAAYKQKNLKTL